MSMVFKNTATHAPMIHVDHTATHAPMIHVDHTVPLHQLLIFTCISSYTLHLWFYK